MMPLTSPPPLISYCDHFPKFCPCDETILFEISPRDGFFFMIGRFSRFLFGCLEQSFPEGIIKPYEGRSLLTIGKVCRRLICYRISSHFG